MIESKSLPNAACDASPSLGIDTVALVLFWVAVNAVAFWSGWQLGGNDFSSTGIERPLRNAFYGAFIGSAQLLVFTFVTSLRSRRILLWPVATSVGFCMGVLLVRIILRILPFQNYIQGEIFGVVIGSSVVGCQWLAIGPILNTFGTRISRLWLFSNLFAWILVEMLSSRLGYHGLWRILIVGAAMGVGTSWALARVHQIR